MTRQSTICKHVMKHHRFEPTRESVVQLALAWLQQRVKWCILSKCCNAACTGPEVVPITGESCYMTMILLSGVAHHADVQHALKMQELVLQELGASVDCDAALQSRDQRLYSSQICQRMPACRIYNKHLCSSSDIHKLHVLSLHDNVTQESCTLSTT